MGQRLLLRAPTVEVSESRPWLRRSLNLANAFLELICLEQSFSCIIEFKIASPGSLGFRTAGVSVSVHVTSHTETEGG